MELLELPFTTIFKVPNLKLKMPKFPEFGPMIVFSVVFLSYFLVMSGIIYDIIVEPPSIGSSQDEATGQVKPVAFLQYRVNGQYIIEGLSAGALFVLGGVGFIILDRAHQKFTSTRNRYLLILAGILCILAAYNLSIVFLRIKIPGYMR